MELKPPRASEEKQVLQGLNRTFMELKHKWMREDLAPIEVLIVPLWN